MRGTNSRHGYTRKAVDKSVSAAEADGRLDLNENAAAICGLRRVADAIDAQGDAAPASLFSTFLAYCKALNLTPAEKPATGKVEGGNLDKLRARAQAKLHIA